MPPSVGFDDDPVVPGPLTQAAGIGGRIRDRPADFRVREIETIAPKPLDADTGRFPHLLLRVTLHDWDTFDFADRLSDGLGISRERIGWAGTKDKRAETTQLFSVDGAAPPLPEIDDAEIDCVGRFGRALHFGDLAGNAFRIVVREPTHPERLPALVEELQAFGGSRDSDSEATPIGVPNWFGPQRFGSIRPVTHRVGFRILDGDWTGAVLAYLGDPHPDEPPGTQAAREFVEETRDWSAALDRFPRRLGHERAILHGLVDADAGADPSDDACRAALGALPSRLQRLFVHAAQSAIFNRIVAERYRKGLPLARPVAGDVVCFTARDRSGEDLVVPDVDRTVRVGPDRVDQVARHCERGRAFVTAPLPGTDTEFAEGEPGELAREACDAAGIEPLDFDLPDPYRSSGTRRAVLVRTRLDVDRDPLTLGFSLPRGAYATSLLRELVGENCK
jgi:tRNA pseudouridine13 synthase